MVPGKGMPRYRNPEQKGNLIIKFEINFPNKNFLSESEMKVGHTGSGLLAWFSLLSGVLVYVDCCMYCSSGTELLVCVFSVDYLDLYVYV